jgi:hypothetical protein
MISAHYKCNPKRPRLEHSCHAGCVHAAPSCDRGSDVIHNWLLTGRFTWYVPTLSTLSGETGCWDGGREGGGGAPGTCLHAASCQVLSRLCSGGEVLIEVLIDPRLERLHCNPNRQPEVLL